MANSFSCIFWDVYRLAWTVTLVLVACAGTVPTSPVPPTEQAHEPDRVDRPEPLANDTAPTSQDATVAPTPAEDPRTLLHAMAIEPASTADYDRKRWKHWSDADGDCQDTRQEVLVAESVRPVTFRDDRRCKVFSGEWLCPYTGKAVTDPSALDIEHVVPLAHAHAHGAAAWTDEQREHYANSLDAPEHLMAVVASANRSKGDKAPHEWLPSERSLRCDYVEDWIRIKARWHLSASQAEHAALSRYLDACDRGDVPELSVPEPQLEPTDEIKRAIIEASIAAYDGNCPCPYHTMRNGRRCGKQSAYSRGGGDAPLCYERDVTEAQIDEYRASSLLD